ncbi:hypothetical protein J4460_05785 [Candidatus Woesearchaeota archaeon]|nr:MAG: hypothetical protein QS99_C0016G0021 [archaeon GW2011_AR4]MBS3130158.1 hypothetical protein [Candidatus Woesearchaeota archaeon]HIH38989.1 hypothetical protein [Candidatus Woesearchaeota archaeon]HIH48800.1 hypothetical protein [Candidatus Woesearchaeota archaeon]HIJ04093.1 hypothetical protein [Candidatus Woesearchaeota archaeon]
MKKNLLLIALLLASLMIAASNDAGKMRSVDITVEVVNQEPHPVEPGDYVEVRFSVENKGTSKVDDIQVELLPEFPFTLNNPVEAVQVIGSLNGRQIDKKAKIITYRLKVDPQAIEGWNELKLHYTYGGIKAWIEPDPYLIDVRTLQENLVVDHVTSDELIPGKNGKYTLTLKNDEDSLVRNVLITFDLTGLPLATEGTSNEVIINKVLPGETKDASLSFLIEPDAASNVYQLPFTITYQDSSGRNFTKTRNTALVIFDPPQYFFTLEQFDTFTENTKGEIVLSISNTGTSTMRFLALTLEDTEGYEVIGPRSTYIGNLESDDFETITYTIKTKGNLQKTVDLSLKLSYKDAFNEEYTTTETVPLRIYSTIEMHALGLAENNYFSSYVSFVVLIFLTIFWVYILYEASHIKMIRYKKYVWILFIILTYAVGAFIFWFLIARKTKRI